MFSPLDSLGCSVVVFLTTCVSLLKSWFILAFPFVTALSSIAARRSLNTIRYKALMTTRTLVLVFRFIRVLGRKPQQPLGSVLRCRKLLVTVLKVNLCVCLPVE